MSGPSSESPPRTPSRNQLQYAAKRSSVGSLVPPLSEKANAVAFGSALKHSDVTKTKTSAQHGQADRSTRSQSLSPQPVNSQEGPQAKIPPQNDVRGRPQLPVFPFASPLAQIAPAPRNFSLAGLHSRPLQGAPRAKRRRLTGAGRRWSASADKFVLEIPPVPFFSDREVPMRDMRGWITTISKNSQKLVWDSFMGALKQEDFTDGGDADICRYILASVIYEAQDPNSSKTQTRQAVNNAIKRELRLSKAAGTTGRGQTFRELFRVKATQAGFATSTSVDDNIIVVHEAKDINRAAMADSTIVQGRTLVALHSGDMHRVPHQRLTSVHPAGGHKGNGQALGVINEAALDENWIAVLQRCGTTFAGERAYWASPDLHSSESLRALISGLVDRRYIHDLKRILVDFRWILKHSQSSSDGILHLVKHGYDALLSVKTPALNVFEREGYRLIRNALMLIRPVLQSAICEPLENHNLCSQLATQLYGRLMKGSLRFAVIATLLESIRIYAERPWLRPLNPCFESPRTDIAIAVRSGINTVSSAIAMSKDGELILTAGEDRVSSSGTKGYSPSAESQSYSVRVWDTSSGECVSRIKGHNSSVLYLAITPNKKHVVSCAGAQLMFWTIKDEKGKYIPEVAHETRIVRTKHDLVFSVAVLPDNRRVVVAHEDHVLRIWNVVKGKTEQEFDKNLTAIFSLDVSPDGKFVVSGDGEGLVSVWRISSGKKVIFFRNEDSVFGVSFMASATVKNDEDKPLKVVAGSLGPLKVWTCPDLQENSEAEPYNPDTKPENLYCTDSHLRLRFYSIRCTANGTIFSGSDDGLVRMWKLNDGVWKATELVNDVPIRLGASPQLGLANRSSAFIAVSDDGRKVASSSVSPLIAVWDIGQYEETLRAQHGILNQSYFPYQPKSVYHTDMYASDPLMLTLPGKQQGSRYHGLSNDLGVYFHVHADDDLRIVKHNESGSLGNVLKVMVHDTDERIITFDESTQSSRCGSFCTFKNALTERKGVAVRFTDQSLAFFEVELTASTGA